jgi:transposase
MTYTRWPSSIKNQLVGYTEAGMTVAQAVQALPKEVDMPEATAHHIVEKFKETGSTDDRPRTRVPRKVTLEMREEILAKAQGDRLMTYEQIGKSLDPPLSGNTVGRVCAEEGYHRRTTKQKPSRLEDEH